MTNIAAAFPAMSFSVVAARLVANAGAGEVLLAASVYSGTAGQVRADLLTQAATVRGRTGTIDIYRINVLGPRG